VDDLEGMSAIGAIGSYNATLAAAIGSQVDIAVIRKAQAVAKDQGAAMVDMLAAAAEFQDQVAQPISADPTRGTVIDLRA